MHFNRGLTNLDKCTRVSPLPVCVHRLRVPQQMHYASLSFSLSRFFWISFFGVFSRIASSSLFPAPRWTSAHIHIIESNKYENEKKMGKNLKWMKPVSHPVVLTIPFRSRSLPPSLLHFCVASRTDFRSTFRRISLRMKWQNLYLMSQLETAMSELQNLFFFFGLVSAKMFCAVVGGYRLFHCF